MLKNLNKKITDARMALSFKISPESHLRNSNGRLRVMDNGTYRLRNFKSKSGQK